MNLDAITTALTRVPDAVWATVAATVVLFLLWQTKRAIARTTMPGADLLTYLAAGIATSVSAQGMWRFFEQEFPEIPWQFRAALFAFIELGVLASAVRARRNMRDSAERAKTDLLVRPSAGIDGTAVWVLTALTAVLSSLESQSLPEFLFRLAAPFVAAWLWERGMAIERQRITGRSRINWRLTPERVLVWLGLAEATDRTASEVDAHRRLTRVALTAKKVHQLRAAGASERKIRAALVKRDHALDKAVEHTGLARDERMQWALLDMVTTLGGADSLSDVLGGAKAPWAMLDHPAVTGAAKHREAVQLAEAMREWTDAIKQQRDPEVSAAITSMAAYIAGRDATELTSLVTSAASSPAVEVTDNRADERTNHVDSHRQLVVLDPITAADTSGARDDDQTRDSDGDNDDDRDRPDEQDNRKAEEWIARRCRGQNGVGRKPTQAEVQERFGFSNGWARNRIANVRSQMIARGYQFESDGTVYAPTRSSSDSDTSTREEASA